MTEADNPFRDDLEAMVGGIECHELRECCDCCPRLQEKLEHYSRVIQQEYPLIAGHASNLLAEYPDTKSVEAWMGACSRLFDLILVRYSTLHES